MKRVLIAAVAALALAACSPPASDAPEAAGPITPVATEVPAGTYKADPYHTSVTFTVNHLGLSHYTARFTKADITLTLDPADPAAASVGAVIDPTSIRTDFAGDYRASHPGARFATFDQALAQDDNWLDAGDYPQITFQSTSVTLTGPNAATVAGDLTIKGVTKPVILEATFNGGMAMHPGAGAAAVGFSARTKIKRSDYGITFGIPPEGSTLGVGDEMEVIIESELLQQVAPAAP